MKNVLLFGIVTYKEKYWECDSFNTLVDSFKQSQSSEQLHVFIVDNTDVSGWKLTPPVLDVSIGIEYVNLKNPGISVAYNTIVAYAMKNQIKWTVFLDQDTQLPIETYKVYFDQANIANESLPIKIPAIYSNNALMSPSVYKNFRSYPFKDVLTSSLLLDKISCINSGLMIQNSFFEKIGGYNEKLKLDFCDHDFIEKVKNHIDEVKIIDLKLIQNFSADTHNKSQAIGRYKMFCNDLQEFYKKRSKPTVFFNVDLPHLLKLTYIHKSLAFLKIRF